MVACCSSIGSPVVPHAKVNIHSHSHTHKHTVSISNECVFRRHCHSHSMCLEAFNFGWLNSYVYCWNDQKKFHYRILFYFCIMLGEVMMLAMNARRKNTWVKPCIRVLSDGWSLKLRVSIIFTITLLKVVAVVVLLSFDCHSSKNDEIWNFFTWNWVRLRKYLLFGRKQIQISSIITGNLITEQ